MFRNSGLHGLWALALPMAFLGCDEVEDFRAPAAVVGVGDSSGGMVLPPTGLTGSTGPTGSTGRTEPTRAMSSMRPSDSVSAVGVPTRTQQTILIASFNIQTFGVKKVTDPVVVDRIVRILRLFDVIAIQEVRATDQTVLPQLLQMVNSQGARYDFILGPRLGRTDSKEQYCYVYDTTRILSSPSASYTVNDTADLLHREPLVGRFATQVPAGYPPFTFSLMNIHTDPGEVKQELPVMHTVLQVVREYEWSTAREDDVMMMGDLNAAPSKFGNLAQVPGIYWVIRDQPTNTRRTELYDNILFDRGPTNEFVGRAGVLDMATLFGIPMEEALMVSDHNPIWAEFSIVEQPSAYSTPGTSGVMANQGYGSAR
ncbi:MAG: endonuclease/exonuclease/phosphatase [Planctomycetota bacterium]|nr:endonuclease/exonuclease/phosphatase [Planctomycetota bacterium]